MDPIGLYLHIPYCLHKCGYCDFNSHNINEAEMESYVRALLMEMEQAAKGAKDRRVTTIFFGGGTPTTLPFADLARILEACRRHFQVDPEAEITCEANPATIPQTDLAQLREAGFNRLSIGVQSFDQDELKRLERVHSVDEVYLTVERARQAHFENLSLDLIFGLPGQTASRWESNLQKAIDLDTDHMSAYNLTIEPDTVFYKQQSQGQLTMPPDDFQRELFEITIDTLTKAGYEHYEISNYAKPGKQCRHNLNYWVDGDFIGLGAGASSAFNGERYKNVNLPARYIAQINQTQTAVESRETPDRRQRMGEAVMLGLRLKQGLNLNTFAKQFGISFHDAFGDTVTRLGKMGLIELRNGQAALTREGLFLADSVIVEFITEPEKAI
ncbi:MAG: radical SAM family heme chaperone HemW [Nitrospinota bacterium]|nr:radical SAM family heme chaperone HemW [Nitrospinota bacterium]